jgi:hypothetical protein
MAVSAQVTFLTAEPGSVDDKQEIVWSEPDSDRDNGGTPLISGLMVIVLAGLLLLPTREPETHWEDPMDAGTRGWRRPFT